MNVPMEKSYSVSKFIIPPKESDGINEYISSISLDFFFFFFEMYRQLVKSIIEKISFVFFDLNIYSKYKNMRKSLYLPNNNIYFFIHFIPKTFSFDW